MGQIGEILPSVPLWMGETTRDVALALARRLERVPGTDSARASTALERASTFRPGVPVVVGDIRITPLLVDHSAFDAYMFLVEAEDRKILHTGDFREHGPRGKALPAVLRHYVGQVDWLICEGTNLSRPQRSAMTEFDLGKRARRLMAKHQHVFVLCSSTNIDRIAVLSHCAPRRRPVVCDGYQKEVLNIVEAHSGHRSGLYQFHRVIPYWEGNVKLRRWMEEQGFVMFIRANDRFRQWMEPYREDCVVLYSLWDGYLEGPNADPRLLEFLEDYPLVKLHTSGHAGVETIKAVCRTVSPRQGIIPIHGETPEAFRALVPGARVVCLEDGRSIEL